MKIVYYGKIALTDRKEEVLNVLSKYKCLKFVSWYVVDNIDTFVLFLAQMVNYFN